jgi:hypothetical protein
LAREHLYALLQIDEGNVEAEYITGETGDISQAIAGVRNSQDPVHDQRPYANPAHEGKVADPIWHNDIVNSVIENSNWA